MCIVSSSIVTCSSLRNEDGYKKSISSPGVGNYITVGKAVARAYGIEDWPVAAVKCFVGHTMAAAGGDQLASALGGFAHG